MQPTFPTHQTVVINGGTIDNTPIGQTTPAAGAFTTLTAQRLLLPQATSGAMPGAPSVGQTVFVTNLGFVMTWNGTYWVSDPFDVQLGGLNGPAGDFFGVWYADQFIGKHTGQTSCSTPGGAVGVVTKSGLGLLLTKLRIWAEASPDADKLIDFYRQTAGTWSAEAFQWTVPAGVGAYLAELTGASFDLDPGESLVPHSAAAASWIAGGLEIDAVGRYRL